ncbi:MAG TPA: Zn-dependent alcohol dehydrogenase [Candidatus Nitrosopolaris sp.]|nr:Zn-dependent alcohol dehydrogenase [Candidatus Nitrosopolaris sp.]
MKAAVMRAIGEPLHIEQVQVDAPGPREVLVRTAAAGVCHSDLHVLEGSLPSPLPTILGHEPAGVVEAVGHEVRSVARGDHVIGCLSVFCGTCEYCVAGRPNLCEGTTTVRRPDEPPRLAQDGEPIAQFAHLSAFAERMLVHENALVRIRPDVPLDRVALIGCGVTTGLGAVFNTARVRAGAAVAVIGCGGIGLSVVQGCRIAGAGRIIAVDTVPWKLDLAARLGATDGVNAAEMNPVASVVEMTTGGVDYAFEALGTPPTVRQAVRMARKGGTIVMIGVVPMGTNVELPGADIVLREKTILGCMMGSNRFRTDMPRYVDLYRKGVLRLDEMISARLPLEGVNDALDALRRGTAARSVVVFES